MDNNSTSQSGINAQVVSSQQPQSNLPQKSSKKLYIICAGILILIIIAGITYLLLSSHNSATQSAYSPPASSEQKINTQTATPTPIAQSSVENNSNTQLDKDTANIQNQLNQVNQAQAAVNQDANNSSQDQPQQ